MESFWELSLDVEHINKRHKRVNRASRFMFGLVVGLSLECMMYRHPSSKMMVVMVMMMTISPIYAIVFKVHFAPQGHGLRALALARLFSRIR